jgi:hypothetical protein
VTVLSPDPLTYLDIDTNSSSTNCLSEAEDPEVVDFLEAAEALS